MTGVYSLFLLLVVAATSECSAGAGTTCGMGHGHSYLQLQLAKSSQVKFILSPKYKDTSPTAPAGKLAGVVWCGVVCPPEQVCGWAEL